MQPQPIHVDAEVRGSIALLKLSGNGVPAAQADPIAGCIRDLTGQGMCRFVVDLSGTRWVSAAALNGLVEGLKTARDTGGDLWLTGVSGKVEEILNVTHLDTVFPVLSSPDRVVDAAGRILVAA